jgi:hypothetical protein
MFDWCKELPEDDLCKIETCRRFNGFYVKIYSIVTYSAFVGITYWIVYKCMNKNNVNINYTILHLKVSYSKTTMKTVFLNLNYFIFK